MCETRARCACNTAHSALGVPSAGLPGGVKADEFDFFTTLASTEAAAGAEAEAEAEGEDTATQPGAQAGA